MHQILQDMVNAEKLLADLHHAISAHRRFLVSGALDPTIKKMVMDRPISSFLFGEDLTQKIKQKKEMQKAAADLRRRTSAKIPRLSSYPQQQLSSSRNTQNFHSRRLRFPTTRRNKPARRRGRKNILS